MDIDELELRQRNKKLISLLKERQSDIKSVSRGIAGLVRKMDKIQKGIDLLPKKTGSEVHAIFNKSSSLTECNANNNNASQQMLHSSDIDTMEKARRERITPFTQPPFTTSPGKDLLSSPQKTTDSKENDVLVFRGVPDEIKQVRRKLADEMTQNTEETFQSTAMDDSIFKLRAQAKTPLNDSTNEYRTPLKSAKIAYGTPKSILKHRRLIDKNVQVKGQFNHTPGWIDRVKHTKISKKANLELPSNNSNKTSQRMKTTTARRVPSAEITELEHLKAVSFDSDPVDISALRSQLGNVRNAACSWKEVKTPDRKVETGDRDTMPTPPTLSKIGRSPESADIAKQRLMGYDWIAALIDDSDASQIADKREDYFKELMEFRRLHRDECQNNSLIPANGRDAFLSSQCVGQPPPDPASPSHTCIHSYAVNDRLYAVPMHPDVTGVSRCAVCSKKKQTPSRSSPSFVRISIPRTTLSSPYKVKPHRRKSFDPSDSVALSKHCLAGYIQPCPAKLPIGKNVDLANETNRLKSKFIMTMTEAEELAAKCKTIPRDSRNLDQTTLYSKEVKKITDQLINMSNAFKFQCQLLNKTPIN